LSNYGILVLGAPLKGLCGSTIYVHSKWRTSGTTNIEWFLPTKYFLCS